MFIHHMQHPVVEVGILHVLQSGLSLESTPLSANGGILGKDARVLEYSHEIPTKPLYIIIPVYRSIPLGGIPRKIT